MNKERILKALAKLLDDEQLIEAGSDAEPAGKAVAKTIAKIDGMLWILYPGGVKPGQYADLVRTVRVLDRLCQLQVLSEADEAKSDSPAPVANAGAPQHVDDDATAPIVTDQLFAQAISSKRAAWNALSEGTLRSRDNERDAPAVKKYTSLFKYEPDASG